MNKIYLENDESTNKLGALISEQLKNIDKSLIEIHLEGDLGAGKNSVLACMAGQTPGCALLDVHVCLHRN